MKRASSLFVRGRVFTVAGMAQLRWLIALFDPPHEAFESLGGLAAQVRVIHAAKLLSDSK
jgi:hypothetical protein